MSARRRVRFPAEARGALDRVAALRHPSPVFLVGGAIRDAALGRPVGDLDLATVGARGLAAAVARAFKGHLVTLDAENAVYRLVLPPKRGRGLRQIDVAEILGRDIHEDLRRRDFTVNAVALKLEGGLSAAISESDFIDPRGGLADLARGTLRVEDDRPFKDDPLRLLRAFRIAAQTGLLIDRQTQRLIREHRRLIRSPAGERVQAELLALLAEPGASRALRALDECGLLTALFQDLEPARRCAEDYYGAGGVLKHSLDVCARVDFLLTNFGKIYPDLARRFQERLVARSSGGAPERAVLMLAALLHDVSKPETAKIVAGRLRFFRHDELGAERAAKILRALRFSRDHVDAVSAIVRHHLRPGHLASGGPLTDRAIYRFFRDLGELAPGLLAVCWGDHASYVSEPRLKSLLAAACGEPPRASLSRLRPEETRKTARHLQLVSRLLRRCFDADRAPVPTRLLDGVAVMKALKIPPGPKVGKALERLREAQAEGKVKNRAQALSFVSRLRLAAAPTLAALIFAGAAAATPAVTPSTLQCDGSFAAGGTTHTPSPTVRAGVQDAVGLRVGTARMGAIGPSATTPSLWRFDSVTPNVTITNNGCAADPAHCPVGGSCWKFLYTYTDENGALQSTLGQCIYDSDCASANNGVVSFNAGQIGFTKPVGLASCPGAMPTPGATTLFPAPTGTPLIYSGNGAALLDGAQFATVQASTTAWILGGTYKLSAWFKTSAGGTQQIISHDERWYGGQDYFWGLALNSGKLQIDESRDTATPHASASSGPSLNDGAWHQVHVVRRDGQDRRLYADGKLLATITPTISTGPFTANVSTSSTVAIIRRVSVAPTIGALVVISTDGIQQGVASNYFTGQIDEIRVTNTALSDDDILLEYVGTLHKFSSDGVNYSTAPGSYLGGTPANATQAAQTYLPGEANSANASWIFAFQSTQSISAVASAFTVSIDNGAPIAPDVSGTPTSANDINWTWGTPGKICVSPGTPGAGPYYQLVNGASGAVITPPSTVFEPSRVVSDHVAGAPNQMVCRRLLLTDVWGTSALSASATAYTQAAPPIAPAAASISSGGVVASWSANGNPAGTRYEVTYSTDANFAVAVGTRVGVGDNFVGTSINVTGLAAGTTYSLRLRAFNGRAEDSFGGAPTTSTTTRFVTQAGAPALSGAPLSSASVRWTWATVPGAVGYTLYDSPTQAVLFGPNGAGVTFSSSSLSVNTRYDAEVEAVMPGATPVSPRGRAFTYTLANPPTTTAVSAAFVSSVSFSWSANGNPSGTAYQIVVATDPAFAVVVATLSATTTNVLATNLLPGTTYYSQVRAFNGVQSPTAFAAFPQAVTAPNASVTISSTSPSPYVAASGLIGAWQFDENTGTTTVDGSNSGNSGSLVCVAAGCASTPTWTSGPAGLGGALSFNGLSGAVLTNSGAPFAFVGSLTVEAWVNPQTTAQLSGAGIVAVGPLNQEDFALDVSAGAFRFLTSNGGASVPVTVATATIAANQWTHVVGVYDQAHATSTLYLNGRPAAIVTGVPARANSGTVLSVGNRRNAAGAYALGFAGAVDSVRVFSTALNAAQVLADYLGAFVSSVTPPSPNSGIIVGLPPNAFSVPAQIFISADPINHPVHIPAAILNAGLAAAPSGLTLAPNALIEVVPIIAGVPFTLPLGSSATVTIPYQDNGSGLVSGTNPPLPAAALRMYTLNTTVNAWTLLPTSVDTVNHRVTGVTPHFSIFGLFAPATIGASLSGARAYPVPWKPGTGGRFDGLGVTFSGLPASGTIRILTLAGRRIRDFSFNGASAGSVVWDGNNDDGRRAASGVYFAKITSGVDGSAVLVKFAIER